MNEGVTQNEVYYKKVDDLENVVTKEELLQDDQLLLVKNDSAKRTSLGTIMDKMLEQITVPQYTINATPTNTTITSSGVLTASSDIIGRLTPGLFISVSLTGVLGAVTDDPWTLTLKLSQNDQTLTYPIYTPDGVQVTNHYPLTNEVFNLVFLSNVQIDSDTALTGWFIPDKIHNHDDRYYLTREIDEKVKEINNAIIPITRGGSGATTAAKARKNLGINPWVIIGQNRSNSVITNSGYYRVLKVMLFLLKSCCLKMRISPADNNKFSFVPVEVSVILKRSDTSKSTPIVYCNTGADYYEILSKMYFAYDASNGTGNVELWYKNNSTYNPIKVSVFECSVDYLDPNDDGLDCIMFDTENKPLDAIDSSLTTVKLISDIVTERVATKTSSGLLTADGYTKLLNTASQASLDAHIADNTNPHKVTKAQVGLGNVDNTADVNKSVKYAVGATNDSAGQKINTTYIKGISASGQTITITKGDDSTSTITTQDKNVTNTLATTTKAYVTGTTSATTNTGTQVFDTGVYLDTTAGTLTAKTFKGALSGTATKATQDSDGQQINTTYIKGLSVSGKTITITKGDGSTSTITTQDTNTDTKVTNTLNTTTKAYVTGTTSATTNTGTQVFDTGVYLDTTAGMLTAKTFKGALSGNASSATALTSSAGSATQPVYFSSGKPVATTYTLGASVPSDAEFTDTTYTAGTGLSLSGTTINHSNSVTAGTAQGDASKTLAFGGTFTIPTVTYDAQGHITAKGTTTMTMPANPNTDTKVTNTLATTTKAYVTGTTSATTNTGTQVFDTGVYLDTTAGMLTAKTFKGALSGNASTATKATQDSAGQQINTTYIKGLSVSGTTLTITKGDGSTSTITTQDTNTDTKVTNTLATTTKAYVTGTTSATTNTGTQVFDTGVYLETTAGRLYASSFNEGGMLLSTKYRYWRRALVGQSGNTGLAKPYYKFASLSSKTAYYDHGITFKVSTYYALQDNSTIVGILTAHFRTDPSAYWESGELVWEYAASGVDTSKFILAHNTSTSPTVVELWVRVDVSYRNYHFDVISEGNRNTSLNSHWTLYNTSTDGGAEAITDGYTQIASTLSTLKNPISGNASTATKLATKRTIALTGSVTGSGTFDGSGNLSIATTTNHTHSYLPLAGGTMTGTINSSKTTGSFLAGNQGTAIINSTASAGSYTMLAKMNSTNGYFTMGTYNNKFLLHYTAKSTVDAKTNAVTKAAILLDENGNAVFPGAVSAGALTGTIYINGSNTRFVNNQFTAGEALATNDLIILDASTGTWFKSTTARTYAGVAMVATASAVYASGATVSANVGMQRTVTAATVGNLAAHNLVLIQGTLGDDGVSFTTDGTITNTRTEGKEYIRAGYLQSATSIIIPGTNPQILGGSGSGCSKSLATTDTGYMHRNIAYGTSTTPTEDATYGGAGSIYISYTE